MSTKVGITAENYEVSESVERTRSDATTGLNKQQKDSDGLKIHGLALPFDKRSRNGVVYKKESIEKAMETLVGCSLLFNHDENNPIGHIEDVELKKDGLYYYGDLNEEKREVESLKRGDIPHVSIQATVNETAETAKKGVVAVEEFLEMSAVTVPGFSSTDVEAEETVKIEKLMKDKIASIESLENPEFELGDFVRWEFGEGSASGEVIERETEVGDTMNAGGKTFEIEEGDGPLYKMQEWDDQEGEFTNNVVKFEDALNEVERPDEAPGSAPRNESFRKKEVFEFSPVPSHVLYEDKNDALQRAKDLGLSEVHKHVMQDEKFWMAGANHEEWQMAIRNELSGSSDGQESVSESFDDYPDAAVENARQALEARDNEEFDNDECGTDVGWERANQLDNGENLSEETVRRMHSFFERHDGNQTVEEEPKEEDCGWLTWQAWGGQEAFDWATDKLEEIEDNEELVSKEPFADYDDFESCVQDNQDKSDPEAYCAAIKRKAEILNDISGENQLMTEQITEEQLEQLEEVAEDDFTGTVADMYEEVSASDAAELMEGFTFSSNPEPVIALAADIMNMQPADLMDMAESKHGDMEDDEEDEAGDMDDDEDDEMEESESSDINETEEQNSQDGDNSVEENAEEKSKEELKKEIEQLKEAVRKLEDTEDSKQETGSVTSEENDGSLLSDEFKNRVTNR